MNYFTEAKSGERTFFCYQSEAKEYAHRNPCKVYLSGTYPGRLPEPDTLIDDFTGVPGAIVHCSECGKELIASKGRFISGHGYGYYEYGKPICYACIGVQDRADLLAGKRIALYVTTRDGRTTVSNWPGSLVIHTYSAKVRKIFSPVGGRMERTDVWFIVGDKAFWGFVQGDNQGFAPKMLKVNPFAKKAKKEGE